MSGPEAAGKATSRPHWAYATLAQSALRLSHGEGLDRLLLVAVVCVWGIAVACLTVDFGGLAVQRAVADVGETFLDVLAGVIVLWAARRSHVRRIRLGWAVLGAATLVYAVGDAAWAWLDLGGGETNSPSIADLAYVGYYPMVVVALFIFQRAFRPGTA